MTKPDKIQLQIIAGRGPTEEVQRIVLMDPQTSTLYGGMTKLSLTVSWDPKDGGPTAVLKVGTQTTVHGFQVEVAALQALMLGVDRVRWEGLGLLSRELTSDAPPPENLQIVDVPEGPVDMTNPPDAEVEVAAPVNLIEGPPALRAVEEPAQEAPT